MIFRASLSVMVMDALTAVFLVALPVGAVTLGLGSAAPVVFFGTLGCTFAVSALRAVQVQLRFDDDEIVVTNYFRTTRIRWEQVAAVTTGNAFAGPVPVPYPALGFRQSGRGRPLVSRATLFLGSRKTRLLEALHERAAATGTGWRVDEADLYM